VRAATLRLMLLHRGGVAAFVCCVASGLLGAVPATASQTLGDLDVSNLSIAVSGKGEALVTYTTQAGRRRHVLAWGAVNARTPDPNVPQVRFNLDYTGGQHSRKNPGYWKRFKACPPYTGPQLVYLVAACTAPDGSHWAVQSWQKLLPMRGLPPFKPHQAAFGFNLSHWTGPLAELEVSQNFTYDGTWTGLFGRLTYDGSPVFGYKTRSATKRGDGYARYAYIDTHDSVYGPGWRHDAGKVLHVGNGAFCYSFVPQIPPPGYPDRSPRGPGNGDFSRVTILGPGVTPDVQWVGPGLGKYDAAQDEIFNERFDRLVGRDDKVCKNER
jgi:hypothetical protein